MKYLIILVLLFFTKSNKTIISNPDYFSPPVDIPILLSGNFGELRANHFHSGIDIRTEGKTGLEVYSAADGEVARIFISPTGFGHALYINHPNGTTTVYGHLQEFREDIAEYAKSVQYENESFSIDIPVPKGKFPVKRGELIARSGNSGSSGGPHLHFEVRDTESEHPLNPLLFNFDIEDTMSPQIQSVMFYPLSEDAHIAGQVSPKKVETVYYDGAYHLKSNPTLSVYGEVGFGIQALDYLDGSWSKCGIYEIDLSVDGELIYTFEMDELDFDETRYLNSHIDYSYYIDNNRRFHKNWVEPGNELNNYPVLINNGKIKLDDGKTHHINYVLKDVSGNSRKLEFKVLSKKLDINHAKEAGSYFAYDQTNVLNKDGVEASFNPGTFYSNFYFEFTESPSGGKYYSPIYKLHKNEVPVHKNYDLSITADNLPVNLRNKALLATVNEKSGKAWALGGKYENGKVTASVRELGNFAIVVDTIAPTIKPVNINNHKTLTNKNKISFKIDDDFSGISSYSGEIDGNWILFEYDAKNDLLEYYFDEEHLTLNTNHQLELIVTDAKDNRTTYEAEFYR